jgi:membrane-associated phospholipid phosphatase
MTITDDIILLINTIVLIIGFYQFYFWCQRNHRREPREFNTKIDRWISLKPGWIWIYSGLYYPVIVLTVFTFQDFREFNYVTINFFFLMTMHMVFFVFYPVVTPISWRNLSHLPQTLSVRFLKYIHHMDKNSNCFPSMHVSVAVLISFHLLHRLPMLGYWVWSFPVLISLSTLFTKQHFVYDVISGAILGCVAWFVYANLVL